ncbi:MAG: hypothetical protein ABI323_11825 [Solirubrobacteraceae bacterium]
MKIERLNVGWFTAPAGIFRAGDDMDRTVRFPVPAYLAETETERILIDTGLNPAATADPAAYYGRPDVFAVSVLEQEQSVASATAASSCCSPPGIHPGTSQSGSAISCSVPMSPTSRPAWTATGFRSSPTTTISSDAPQTVYA